MRADLHSSSVIFPGGFQLSKCEVKSFCRIENSDSALQEGSQEQVGISAQLMLALLRFTKLCLHHTSDTVPMQHSSSVR